MRHGQAVSNVREVMSCWPETFKNHLTKVGRETIKESAKKLKEICTKECRDIDIIFASPIARTRQSAEIVGKAFGIKPKFDKRLMEQNAGVLNGQPVEKFREFMGPRDARRFNMKPENGETYVDIGNRMVDFVKDIDSKYRGKNILIVSHEFPILMLRKWIEGVSNEDFYKVDRVFNKGEIRELN